MVGIIYALFILAPFGELLFITWLGVRIRIIDIVVAGAVVVLILKQRNKLPVTALSRSPLASLTAALLASVLVNLFSFTLSSAWLYLGRTSIYFLFFALLLKSRISSSLTTRKRILLTGLGLLIASCLIQYFLYPSLRNLLYAGYDPHMGRMVGPFLDPNLLGLALVWYLIVLLPWSLLYITPLLLFTYSRISMLTGIISVGYWYTASTKRWMVTLLAGVLMIGAATLLPRSEGIGTDIWRVNSLLSKPEAFRETIAVAKRNPLFGIGFNTLPQQQGSSLPYPDNSRFGIDNTLFTLLATTGMVGILGYIGTFILLWKTYATIQARALTVAFFVHSLSVNSFFTPTLFLLYTLLIFYIQSSLPVSSRSRQRRSPQPI